MREINANHAAPQGGVNPLNQHFGLGNATIIDTLKIYWPKSGITQIFTNVTPDRFIEITEGDNTIYDGKKCFADLPPKNPGFITGNVQNDVDSNCVFNPLIDYPLSNRMIQAMPGPYAVFSDNNGNYELRVPEGNYLVKQATVTNDIFKQLSCPGTDSIYTVNVSAGNIVSDNNFKLVQSKAICGPNISIALLPGGIAPCPCQTVHYCVTYDNTNASPITTDVNGFVTFQINVSPASVIISNITVTSECNCAITLSGTTITGNSTQTFASNKICIICFDVLIPCSFPLPPLPPTPIITTASIQGNCPGNTPFMSSNTHTDLASCAVDPNDKLVAPKGCGPFGNISRGEPLNYSINFQNTGTAPAHNIVLRDAIDSDLDITTLRILASTHIITRVEIIPDNSMIISYDGIELPDSTSNLQGSIGSVVFSISPKNNVPDGTAIINQAGIYFDYNEVVLTNTTLNTIRDNPEPIANFTAKHNCTNTGLVYDFTYTGGTADNAAFFWDFGAGASPQTSTQQNPSGIIFNSIGTKQISLTVTRFGCMANITKDIEVISVISDNKVTICHKGHTISVSQSALQSHLAHGDCLGPCETSTTKLASNNKSESIITEESILQVYPNPANETVNLTYSLPNGEVKGYIDIYNAIGQKIQSIPVQKSTETIILNTSSFINGLYLITLTINGEVKGKEKVLIIK